MKSLATAAIATGLGMLGILSSLSTAQAMSMPRLGAPIASDVTTVGYHDHWHGHHDHDCHSGHRHHGNDSYYDNNDDSGVLFKSFVTGTLFNRSSRQTSDSTD